MGGRRVVGLVVRATPNDCSGAFPGMQLSLAGPPYGCWSGCHADAPVVAAPGMRSGALTQQRPGLGEAPSLLVAIRLCRLRWRWCCYSDGRQPW